MITLYNLNEHDAKELLRAAVEWVEAGCKRKSDAGKDLRRLTIDFLALKTKKVTPHTGDKPPKVGDYVFIYSDDFVKGGLAEVTVVEDGMSAGKMVPFITTKESRSNYNWLFLKEHQKRLAKSYSSNGQATIAEAHNIGWWP